SRINDELVEGDAIASGGALSLRRAPRCTYHVRIQAVHHAAIAVVALGPGAIARGGKIAIALNVYIYLPYTVIRLIQRQVVSRFRTIASVEDPVFRLSRIGRLDLDSGRFCVYQSDSDGIVAKSGRLGALRLQFEFA